MDLVHAIRKDAHKLAVLFVIKGNVNFQERGEGKRGIFKGTINDIRWLFFHLPWTGDVHTCVN